MIAVDASALLSVLLQEPGWEAFENAMIEAGGGVVSPASVLEATMRLMLRGDEGLDQEVDALLDQMCLTVVPVDIEQLDAARAGFRAYGKGTGHPAKLNFGDCFSYALAKTRDLPLLYKGNDFNQTDVRSALQEM